MSAYTITITGNDATQANADRLARIFGSSARITLTQESRSIKARLYRASELAGNAQSEFETLAEEMSEWYNNLPESFQQGSKGDELQEAESALGDAQQYAEEAVDGIDEMQNTLEKVLGAKWTVDDPLPTLTMHVSGKGMQERGVRSKLQKADLGNARVVREVSASSRSQRFAEAVDMLAEARGIVEEVKEDIETMHPDTVDRGDELQEAIDGFDAITEACENGEGVDVMFPGMY